MTVSVTVRLDEKMGDALSKLAQATERPRSFYLKKAMDAYLRANYEDMMEEIEFSDFDFDNIDDTEAKSLEEVCNEMNDEDKEAA